MTAEVKLPTRRPYVAPVLERIELAVNTQNGGPTAIDSSYGGRKTGS